MTVRDWRAHRIHPDQTVGVRVMWRLGPSRVLRAVLTFLWVGFLIQAITTSRPDLLRPSDLGSDTSNYAAAATRLIDGHALYHLGPGDRPAPLDDPPAWSGVPLLSPPPMAVLWVPLAMLPPVIGCELWWASGLAAMFLVVLLLIWRAPPWAGLVLVSMMPWLAITAWSGNVNAFLPAGVWVIWRLARGRPALAGIVAGVLAAVKVTPVVLCGWMVGRSPRTGSWGVLLGVLGAVALSVLIAGPSAWRDYGGIARSTAAAPSLLSIPGLLTQVGLRPELAAMSGPLIVAIVVLVSWRLPGRPALTFAIAAVLSVVVTPVARLETIALAATAFIPLADPLRVDGSEAASHPSVAARVLAIGGVAAGVTAVTASILAGVVVWSTVTIQNDRSTGIVVRFASMIQPATYGYRVGARSSGSAWSVEFGRPAGPALIYDAECRVIGEVSLTPTGGRIVVGAGSSTVGSGSDTTVPLAYAGDCADEAAASTGEDLGASFRRRVTATLR